MNGIDPSALLDAARSVVGLYGGLAVVVVALSAWLAKVIAARILEGDRHKFAAELETMRRRFERLTLVHRIQFESEFRILRRLWAHLSRLRGAFVSVRPVVSVGPLDETREQKLAALFERINALAAAYNAAMRRVDDDSPFYPADIQDAAQHAIQTANLELLQVRTDQEPFRSEWYDKGEKNRAKFLQQLEAVSTLIRARLERLAITNESE